MFDDRILLTVSDAAELAMVSRSAMYERIQRKEIATVDVGGRLRIPAKWLRDEYLLPEHVEEPKLATMTIQTVAGILSVGQGTVRQLIRDGHLTPCTSARRPRIRLSEVQRFVDSLPVSRPADLATQVA